IATSIDGMPVQSICRKSGCEQENPGYLDDTEHAELNAEFRDTMGRFLEPCKDALLGGAVDWIDASAKVKAVDLKRTHQRPGCALRRFLIALLAFLLPWAFPLLSTEFDIRQQLIDLNEQIAKEPRKAELYVSRGDLSRAQQKWD